MIATVPAKDAETERKLARMQTMTAEKIAPLVAFLLSDAAAEVNAQIFAVRKNEIVLFSHPRPIRAMAKDEGWSPETIASELLPAFRSSLPPLTRTSDIFGYDPI
jgi:hypothetical protein